MSDIPFFQSPLLNQIPTIKHGFFTRVGGISNPPFDELNAGYTKEPEPIITENRKRMLNALDVHYPNHYPYIQTLHQIHSCDVLFLNEPLETHDDLPKGDAIVTLTSQLPIGIITADCMPILMCDPIQNIIASTHAGWQGAYHGIIEQTILMMEKHGAKRNDIMVAIGPCIHVNNCEIQNDFPIHTHCLTHGGKKYFDLMNYGMSRLIESRITQNHICTHVAENNDTYDNEKLFYSFRRSTHQFKKNNPNTHERAIHGNQMSLITLNQ
jgi:YfiH family protein